MASPRVSRPPDSRSREAACLASSTVLRSGPITTMVTSRTRAVTAAAADRAANGSTLRYTIRSSTPRLANGPASARRAHSSTSGPPVPGVVVGSPTPTSMPAPPRRWFRPGAPERHHGTAHPCVPESSSWPWRRCCWPRSACCGRSSAASSTSPSPARSPRPPPSSPGPPMSASGRPTASASRDGSFPPPLWTAAARFPAARLPSQKGPQWRRARLKRARRERGRRCWCATGTAATGRCGRGWRLSCRGWGWRCCCSTTAGTGGNPGAPTGEGLAADARAALAYLAGRPEVDPDRVVYFGESLGAAVALRLAIERPPAALVLRSPFASLAEVGRHHYPLVPVSLLLRDRYDSAALAGRLAAPLLVVAGSRDRIVPAGHTRRLFEAAPRPKRLVVLDGADHNDPDLLAGPRLVGELRSFLHGVPRLLP